MNIPLLSGLGRKAERLSCLQTGTPKLANADIAEADARDTWKLHLACKSRSITRWRRPLLVGGDALAAAERVSGWRSKSFGLFGEAVKNFQTNLCKGS
jgi:hypothetical protein